LLLKKIVKKIDENNNKMTDKKEVRYVQKMIRKKLHTTNNLCDDPASRLSSSEIDPKKWIGKPLCVEHNSDSVVGSVNRTWTDAEGNVWAEFKIDVSTLEGKAAFASITQRL
jgi:hypothetical protein